MKRREFLKKAGLGGAAGASVLAGPAIAAQAGSGKRIWRMASSFPGSAQADGQAGAEALHEGARRIARRVGELTGGQFQIAFVNDVGLAGAALVDAVRHGKLDIAHVSLQDYIDREPAFAFAAGLPFGLDGRHQRAWVVSGGGAQAMAPLFAEFGLVHLLAGHTGAQLGAWHRHEIATADDLASLKIAASGLAARIYERLGAQPVSLSADRVRPALAQGDIEAAQWMSPHDDEKGGFPGAAAHYYYPGLWQSGPQASLAVNRARWQLLPEAHRAALQTACNDAAARIAAHYDAANPRALRRLLAGGTQLHSLPRSVLIAAEQAANSLYEELNGRSAHWQRVYAQWKSFRDEQDLWSRFVQYGADSFSYTPRAQAA